jgi:hypothetical protein
MGPPDQAVQGRRGGILVMSDPSKIDWTRYQGCAAPLRVWKFFYYIIPLYLHWVVICS